MANLYQTHRPRLLNDIVGHKSVINNLKKRAKTKDWPQSMYLTGVSGSGKCVTRDTLILTDSGFSYIDEFSDGKDGFTPLVENISTVNKMSISSHFYEETVNKTIKVTTRFGFEIEGTEDHPLMIFNKECKFVFKKLKDIVEGDFVCLQKNMNIFNNISPAFNFKFVKKLNNTSKKVVNLPKTCDTELARFLGYFIANGCWSSNTSIALSSNNIKIQQDINNIIKNYGLELRPRTKTDTKDFAIFSVEFREFIDYLCGNKEKNTARFKSVPQCILKGTKEVQINFLTALFDCDSSLYKNTFEFSTASPLLQKEVANLLLNLGVIPIMRKRYNKKYDYWYSYLNVRGDDLDKLFMLITSTIKYDYQGFSVKKNPNAKVVPYLLDKVRMELKELNDLRCKRYFGSAKNVALTSIPKLKTYLEKNKLNKLIATCEKIEKHGLFFMPVKSVEIKTEETKVYDFTIPTYHNFYSNGFISHNTSIARIIAKTLTCEDLDSDGNPCNKCEYCKDIDNEKFQMATYEYNASNLGIEEMRAIEKQTQFRSLTSHIKVFFIDELQELHASKKAQKNILNLLEKKNKYCYFILGSMDDAKVDKAIKNRCTTFKLNKIDDENIATELMNICSKEEIKVTDKVADILVAIAQNSDGSLRTAISHLETAVYGNIWDEDILLKEIGVVTNSKLLDIVGNILEGNINVLSNTINEELLDKIKYSLLLTYKKQCGMKLSKYENNYVQGLFQLPVKNIKFTIAELNNLMKYTYLTKGLIEFTIINCIEHNKVKEIKAVRRPRE